MVWCESVIAFDATINAETDTLEVMNPTSLTTRTGHGKPKLTHFAAWTSTDDVQEVYVTPAGYADAQGIPCPCVRLYGATESQDLDDAKLANPIEIPENTLLNIYARSETAANTVVVAWLVLEYPTGGKFVDVPMAAGVTRRAWEHGAALVSVVPANSTDITTLFPGRTYAVTGVGCAAVNGATAGCVGPAFIKFRNSEYEGAEMWYPLINGANYSAAGGTGWLGFKKLGLKTVPIQGGTPFITAGLGYTAEQPQAVIELAVSGKLFS